MRVLVTGSAGFLGMELARRLKRAGHTVTGIDLVEDGLADRAVRHDLREGPAGVRSADVCVHLAVAVGGVLFNQRSEVEDENALIDRSALETCRLAGCDRLVLTSSIKVFETSPTFEHDALRADVRELIAFTGAQVDVRFSPTFMRYERGTIRDFDLAVPAAFGWAPRVRTITQGLMF